MTVILGDEMERGNVTHMTYLATIFFYWFRRYQAWLRKGQRNIWLAFIVYGAFLLLVVFPTMIAAADYALFSLLLIVSSIVVFPLMFITMLEVLRRMMQWQNDVERIRKIEKHMKDWK